MKKILCPTDFSDSAHNGIAYAASFAQAAGCELTIFHVQSLYDIVPTEMLIGQALVNTLQDLKAQSDEVSKAFKITCNIIVEPSLRKLSNVIQEKSNEYDLIIMGSNGPDSLAQLFMGSNTYNAAISTRIPLLMVPYDFTYNGITKIACAFDYLGNRELPISKLIDFARLLKAEVTVLQIMEEAQSKDADQELKDFQNIFQNAYADDVSLKFDTIRSKDTAQSINSYISREHPDILAVYSFHLNVLQRLFHKSVIKDLVATGNCPVLIIHHEQP